MLSYQTFMKHAEKVTKEAPETRPILKGVLHREDGSCIVTDAFRLYFARRIHNHNETTVITPNGKKLDGSYPDVTRIIQVNSYAKQEIQVNVRELLKAIDLIYSVAKLTDEVVEIKLKNDGVYYKGVYFSGAYKYPLGFQETVILNAKYMLDALNLFKSAKYEEIKVYFYGDVRPLVMKTSYLTALIMPRRRV